MHGADNAGSAISFGPFGRMLIAASKAGAMIGGTIFVALVAMSIVSIGGRKLFSAPVPGDVELLQLFAAIGASTFFAWCHLVGGDVKVDFFTQRLRPSAIHLLDAAGSFLVGSFGALIAWRTGAGALTVKLSGEETMILGLPQWWGPALMVPGFVLLALAGFYMAERHVSAAMASAEAGPRPAPVDDDAPEDRRTA
jgi:TRAP-type C4-dicarboxylate transport system permease small subunit